MKNQTKLWSIRGIGMSLMMTLLATGADALGAKPRRGKNRTKSPSITVKKNISQNQLDRLIVQFRKQTIRYSGNNSVNSNTTYKEIRDYLTKQNTIADISVEGKPDFHVVSYLILRGDDFTNVKDPNHNINRNVDPGNYTPAYVTSLASILPNYLLKREDVIRAIVHSGCLDAVTELNQKLTTNNLTIDSVQALIDIAQILDGRKRIPRSVNSALYRKALQDLLKHCNISISKLEKYVEKYTNNDGQLQAIISDIYIALKNVLYYGSPTLHTNISSFLTKEEAYQMLSDDNRNAILLNACKFSTCKVIYNWLKNAIVGIQNMSSNNQWGNKVGNIGHLSVILSNCYSVGDPQDTNKCRTPIHCILRNADGAHKKLTPLASRENTVRALLMLMVAGANPYSHKNTYTNNSGDEVSGQYAGELPKKSYDYLKSSTPQNHSIHGANFRFYEPSPVGEDIFGQWVESVDDNQITHCTWQPNNRVATEVDRNTLEESLKKMCRLCAFVMGKRNNADHERQMRLIKQRALNIVAPSGQEGPSLESLQDKPDVYIQQLLTALEVIKNMDIKQFLNRFESTNNALWVGPANIKNNLDDFLKNTNDLGITLQQVTQ